MEKPEYEFARKFMSLLKEHWRKTNPDVDRVLNYLKNKYGELPRPDHMAIRSISGIGFGPEEAYQIFSSLGYRYGGSWWIPSLSIAACHFEPPAPGLEKIFFSTILLRELLYCKEAERESEEAIEKIGGILSRIANHVKTRLGFLTPAEPIDRLANFFICPPWVEQGSFIDKDDFSWISGRPYLQETAHVLAHGFLPNHFTFLLKDPSYVFSGYKSMREFAKEIRKLGIPMKKKVEGRENSILCQTSTKAFIGKANWPTSYIEFIKRGKDMSSPTGRYEGFIPNQAQALFKMTAKK